MITRCQVWRVKYSLAKIRTAARELLTLDEKDPRRLFEGSYYLMTINTKQINVNKFKLH